MSEIAEAVQVVEIAGRGAAGAVNAVYKTGEVGYKIIKAIIAHMEKNKAKNLSGNVSMDTLIKYEGNNLGMCRFEGVSKEEIYKVLDEFDIPYAEMPDAEINGVTYTQIAFGKSYNDRMAAAIQTLGHGEIINASTPPVYITSGEVSLDVLQEQDGTQLMYARFPDVSKDQVMEAFNAYGIKYATLPDLNLGDGYFEIAFPPAQQATMVAMMERIKLGRIITFDDYTENADPQRVDELAAEYDRLHVTTDNTKIISSTEKEMVIEIPEGNLIMRDDPSSPPMIAINGAYAVDISPNDISAPDANGNVRITLHKDHMYNSVLPTGKYDDGVRSGNDIIASLIVTLGYVLDTPAEQTMPTAEYTTYISASNTRIIGSNDKQITISVPAENIMQEPGQQPRIAINSDYAIPIPQEDISSPDKKGNVRIAIYNDKTYAGIPPKGKNIDYGGISGKDITDSIIKTVSHNRKMHSRTRAV